jgi:NAD(P)-dependent dehydrogenase (short-subunit alcohol dehydrogenase family)
MPFSQSESPVPHDRSVLITGASAGIGLAAANTLAQQGWRVLLHTRPGPKGSAAFDQLRRAASGPPPLHLVADLASLAEVRRLGQEVRSLNRALDVVVHNAAIVTPDRRMTIDGHEMQFAVNHLAVYLLTHELMPVLEAAGPARIVVTASQVERSGRIDFRDLTSAAHYQADEAYARSKLANVLFTYELANRLAGTPITANCFHPGVVRTGLLNTLLGENASNSGVARLKGAIGGALRRTGLRPPVQDWALDTAAGSATTVYLASSPEVTGVTGQYFNVGKVAESSLQSKDAELRCELWRVSAKLVSVEPNWP